MNAETESSGRSAQPEADSTRFRAPVTDRVNVEPAIIRGMTVTEAALGVLRIRVLLAVRGLARLRLALGLAGALGFAPGFFLAGVLEADGFLAGMIALLDDNVSLVARVF